MKERTNYRKIERQKKRKNPIMNPVYLTVGKMEAIKSKEKRPGRGRKTIVSYRPKNAVVVPITHFLANQRTDVDTRNSSILDFVSQRDKQRVRQSSTRVCTYMYAVLSGVPTPHSPLPTPHSPLPTPHSLLPIPHCPTVPFPE